jgi:predicted porin
MKAKLAALIALSTFTVAATAAPTFYGEIDLSVDYLKEDNANGRDRDVTDLSSNNSFIGLKGDEKLNERLSALYQAEFTFYGDDGQGGANNDSFVPRNLLIGLKDQKLGTVKIGKIDTPVKQLSAQVDTFNNYVENNADIHGIMAGETRIDNTVVYEAPSFKLAQGKVDAKVQLATGEGEERIKASKGGYSVAGRGLGDSWSSSLVYSDKKFLAGVGYDKAMPSRFLTRGFLNAKVKEVSADSNVVAAADNLRAVGRINLDNGLSLRALYQVSEIADTQAGEKSAQDATVKNIDDAQAWLVGAEYNLPNAKAWTVKGQYSQNVVSFKDTTADYEVQQVMAGVDYAFSKQVKVYGHAGYLTIEQANKEDKQVLVGTGLEYKF